MKKFKVLRGDNKYVQKELNRYQEDYDVVVVGTSSAHPGPFIHTIVIIELHPKLSEQ